jgi:hypothetical protein
MPALLQQRVVHLVSPERPPRACHGMPWPLSGRVFGASLIRHLVFLRPVTLVLRKVFFSDIYPLYYYSPVPVTFKQIQLKREAEFGNPGNQIKAHK